MHTLLRILMLFAAFLTLALAGCAITPKIQLSTSDMAMEVKSKVPFVLAVDYSPDGKSVVTVGIDGTARLWDLTGAREAMKFKVPSGYTGDVSYSPDGKAIAISSHDVTTLWDVTTGSQIRKFTGNFGGELSFSPDGRSVLGTTWGFTERTVTLRDVQSGAVIREFKGSERGKISPNGKYIAVEGVENKGIILPTFESFVSLRDLATGKELCRTTVSGGESGAVAFSPDSRQLLVAQSARKNAGADLAMSFKLFDTATGAQVKEFGHARVPSGRFSSLDRDIVGALAFSPDGKYFLSGDRGGRYRLWDVATGTVVRQLKTVDEIAGAALAIHATPSVKFSPDGRAAAIVSPASTRLFDASTGDELATMISFEDGEWLVTTPNGYYNSSEKGDQYLNVTVGSKPYSISQLRESFYRPDLVKVALAGQTLAGLRKVADIKPPPAVMIVETPASVGSDEATVKVKVADQGGGIGDVRVYLNGSAVSLERRNLAVAAVAGKAQVFSYKVRLVSGKNALRAIAFNAENSMQSTDALHVIEASIAATKPSLYAVVVGIQEYTNPKLTLKYSVADANLFADTLKAKAGGLFEKVEITRLVTAKDTTNAAIAEALKTARSKVRPDDLFVFYVASHGTVDEGEYYLVTSNVGSTSTEKLKRDALSQNSIKELIANIPATKKLIVLDTCNAGKLGDTLQVALLTRGMNEDTAFKILSRAVGSTILSAATSQQEALEGYQGHGLFTWVLAEGLNGAADLDKDGFIKTIELASYVDEKVPELAEKVFKHKQFPVVAPSGQAFPIVRVR